MPLKLQTSVTIPTPPFQIARDSRVLIVGSCFAENIGSRLELISMVEEWGERSVYCNPSGIVYNPLSVATAVETIRYGKEFTASDLREHGGLWHSMEHHGKFSASTPSEVLAKINREAVESVDYIIVTLGTAFVYFMDGRAVSNCHKIPEREFQRRKITVEESLLALERIAAAYPSAKVIVTLSPIRHLRDGLSENSLSKATLRVAIDEFCSKDRASRVYFPAYEILLDELRDYRFTTEDMCHPTEQTREYIWERFAEVFLHSSVVDSVKEAQRAERAAAHRPLR